MKNLMKSISALLLVACLTLGLTGCYSENNLWAAKKGDITLPIGGYIYFLSSGYYDAGTKVGTETKVLSATIEDTKAETFIQNKAKESTQQYFFVEEKFKELNLELTEEDLEQIESYTDFYWDTYGQSTVFEPMGVSRDSFSAVVSRSSILRSKVFDAMYGPEGEKAVSDEDFTAYYEENYFYYEYFTASTSTTDEEGNATELDEDAKAELKSKMEAYAQQVKSGKLSVSEAAEAYKAEAALDASTYTSTAAVSANASSEIELAATELGDNESTFLEGSSMFYVVRRLPISERTSTVLESEDDRASVLQTWKNEEFNTYMEEGAKAIEGIEYNNSAIGTFSLKKLVSENNENGTSSVASETESSGEASDASGGAASDASEGSASESSASENA